MNPRPLHYECSALTKLSYRGIKLAIIDWFGKILKRRRLECFFAWGVPRVLKETLNQYFWHAFFIMV